MDPPGSPHSADEEISVLSDQIPKYQRSLRSLHLLTTKFVRILQESKGGELDLREAVRILNVAQKRRIYDITNVLEGVGLVTKISKSMIKWMGALRGENEYELEKRSEELKSELEDLEQKELLLDQQTLWVEQSIRNTKEFLSHLTYVNHEDICSCFTGHTLLVVRAPPGTQLDVPIPKAVQDSPTKYQIHLKSVKGPIDVVLLNKNTVSSAPVVLPVPPPEEILKRAQLAMSASNEKESRTEPRLASANTKHFTESKRTAAEDMKPRQSSCINVEPNRTDEPRYLSKQLQELVDPLKEKMTTEILTQLLASEVFSPLLRLTTPPSDHDYSCNLDDSEGVCDLFDVPMLNV